MLVTVVFVGEHFTTYLALKSVRGWLESQNSPCWTLMNICLKSISLYHHNNYEYIEILYIYSIAMPPSYSLPTIPNLHRYYSQTCNHSVIIIIIIIIIMIIINFYSPVFNTRCHSIGHKMRIARIKIRVDFPGRWERA